MSAGAGPLARLLECGQSPWYDNLTRDHARGGLRDLLDLGVRGVTSNPTIFEKAMAAGDAYDADLAALTRAGHDARAAYWELVLDDVGRAADLLRPAYDAAGGADGFVSIEVDPELAHDAAGTVDAAASLSSRLGRPNVMVKIPATVAGVEAVTECLGRGINVNVTLIFSLARYQAVIEAWLAGLERRAEGGGDVAGTASVASFFVSRVDTETDRRLPAGHPLRGEAAVANARLAYRAFRAALAGRRWEALAARGARVQRPLWASTSTKNPDYSPTRYVDELVGPDTVNTLAPASIDALLAPGGGDGIRPDAITERVEEAEATIAALAGAGVDYDDVTDTLEREGVASFAASFRAALETLAGKAALASAT